MTWIPCHTALPACDERVLIATPQRIVIAARTSPGGHCVEGPAFVWEVESPEPSHYEPRSITHWMPLPSRP